MDVFAQCFIPTSGSIERPLQADRVATDDQVIHFHRDHRVPEDHPVISKRFFAQTVSADITQGRARSSLAFRGELLLLGKAKALGARLLWSFRAPRMDGDQCHWALEGGRLNV